MSIDMSKYKKAYFDYKEEKKEQQEDKYETYHKLLESHLQKLIDFYESDKFEDILKEYLDSHLNDIRQNGEPIKDTLIIEETTFYNDEYPGWRIYTPFFKNRHTVEICYLENDHSSAYYHNLNYAYNTVLEKIKLLATIIKERLEELTKMGCILKIDETTYDYNNDIANSEYYDNEEPNYNYDIQKYSATFIINWEY